MNKDKYPMYALALVAGAAIAVWAGLPIPYLFLLACPLLMFLMMAGMSRMHGDQSSESTRDRDAPKRHAAKLDGSHERVNQT